MKKVAVIFVILVALAGGAYVFVMHKDSDHVAAAPAAAPVTPAISAAPPAAPAVKPVAAAPAAAPAAATAPAKAAAPPPVAAAIAKPTANKPKNAPKALPRFSDITLLNTQFGKRHPVTLPFSNPRITKGAKLDFIFQVKQSPKDPTVMKVLPDDCVDVMEVNDLPVKVSTVIGETKRCDSVKGFLIDLKNYFHEGENKVRIVISNKTGATAGLRTNFPSKADLAKEK